MPDLELLKKHGEAGFALLTQHVGDDSWLDRTDPKGLNMASGGRCLLAQVFDSYELGQSILWPEEYGMWLDMRNQRVYELSYEHGFATMLDGRDDLSPYEIDPYSYPDLSEWWEIRLIDARLERQARLAAAAQ